MEIALLVVGSIVALWIILAVLQVVFLFVASRVAKRLTKNDSLQNYADSIFNAGKKLR